MLPVPELCGFSPAIGPSPLFSSLPQPASTAAAPPAAPSPARFKKRRRSTSKACPPLVVRHNALPPPADHHHNVDSSASSSSTGLVYSPLERYFQPSSATMNTTLPSSSSPAMRWAT